MILIEIEVVVVAVLPLRECDWQCFSIQKGLQIRVPYSIRQPILFLKVLYCLQFLYLKLVYLNDLVHFVLVDDQVVDFSFLVNKFFVKLLDALHHKINLPLKIHSLKTLIKLALRLLPLIIKPPLLLIIFNFVLHKLLKHVLLLHLSLPLRLLILPPQRRDLLLSELKADLGQIVEVRGAVAAGGRSQGFWRPVSADFLLGDVG